LVLARFFSVWLGFSGLARFFFWFFVGFGSVRFGFFEPAGFFKNLIGLIVFFFRFGFFGYFFSGFLDLIGFPVFLLTPRWSIRDEKYLRRDEELKMCDRN